MDSERNDERLCDGFNVLSSDADLKVFSSQCIVLRYMPKDQQDAD